MIFTQTVRAKWTISPVAIGMEINRVIQFLDVAMPTFMKFNGVVIWLDNQESDFCIYFQQNESDFAVYPAAKKKKNKMVLPNRGIQNIRSTI